MGLIHDPDAEKRSLMSQRKPLCNGQQTGRACIHYWVHAEKIESNNPDNLKIGEVFRACGWHPSIANEMSESQLATMCNQYIPRRLPLWKRPLAVLNLVEDPGKYDGSFEQYDPLTPEEILALQKGTSESESFTTEPSHSIAAFVSEIGAPKNKDEKKSVSVEDALNDLENPNEEDKS